MEEKRKIYDLIIVGGGPAGLAAGIYGRRAALECVLIEKGLPGGQVAVSDQVENYPGIEDISGMELSEKFHTHAASYGLEILQHEAAAVEPGLEFHSVQLENGDVLDAYAVIIATGGSPKKLGVPGEVEYYGKGVSYCATCDGFFYRGKTVVVIGGGDTAVEEALYLAKLTQKVYLVHRRDALRASRILQQRVTAECKIEILWDTVLKAINADQAGVCSVDLTNVQSGAQTHIDVDGAFIFIGFNPNYQLVPAGIKLNADHYVVTDEKCETNIPGIYVVGDLREKFARQIVVAAADGCTAALAAAHYVERVKADESDCVLPPENTT